MSTPFKPIIVYCNITCRDRFKSAQVTICDGIASQCCHYVERQGALPPTDTCNPYSGMEINSVKSNKELIDNDSSLNGY